MTGLLHHEHVPSLLDHSCDVTLLLGVQAGDLPRENLSGVGYVAPEQMNVLQVHLLGGQALPFWFVACFCHGQRGQEFTYSRALVNPLAGILSGGREARLRL